VNPGRAHSGVLLISWIQNALLLPAFLIRCKLLIHCMIVMDA